MAAQNHALTEDGRISRVEQEFSGIKVEVHNLSQSFGQFVTEMRTEVRGIADRLYGGTRTNWSVIATWVGVCVSWMAFYSGLLLSPIKEKISEQSESLGQVSGAQRDDSYLLGRLEERVAAQKESIDRLRLELKEKQEGR